MNISYTITNSLKTVLLVAVGAALGVAVSVFAQATWEGPTADPTGGNPSPPVRIGNTGAETTEVMLNNLIVNNDAAFTTGATVVGDMYIEAIPGGNGDLYVGDDIIVSNGWIQVAPTTEGECNGLEDRGIIRYNATQDRFEGCAANNEWHAF